MVVNIMNMALEFKYPLAIAAIIPVILLLIYIIRKDVIRYKDTEQMMQYKNERKPVRLFMMFSRSLMALLLLIAVASPFEFVTDTVRGDNSLKILVDKSISMELFKQTLGEELLQKLDGKIPVDLKEITAGEFSPIGSAILANMKGDDNVMLITDGNSNTGTSLKDVVVFAKSINTSINAILLKPEKTDVGVKIIGPSNVVYGYDTEYKIDVNVVGNSKYQLRVILDDTIMIDEVSTESGTYIFSKVFETGTHKIKAELFVEGSDYFPQNNVFFKSLNVLDKPTILFWNQKNSPMQTIVDELYEATTSATLPADLSKFSSIIMNDIPIDSISDNTVTRLTDYISNGNGLVVIGGRNSYDGYKDTLFETLLPVQAGGISQKRDVNIVILLDISGSGGQNFNSSVSASFGDIGKALSLQLIDDIQEKDRVGFIAFRGAAKQISALSPVGAKRDILKHKVSKLWIGGNTYISKGMLASNEMLKNAVGSKNVIIISDGITKSQIDWDKIQELKAESRKNGIKYFAIKVGSKSDKGLLKGIGEDTGGVYFHPQNLEGIKVLFGETEDSLRLISINLEHFITKNLELDMDISGFNFAAPRAAANTLVTTMKGVPIVVVQRFGLGRVVSFLGDDGSSFSPKILSEKNSALMSRMINWAVGDPRRTKEYDVTVKDGTLDDEVEILVKSNKQPSAKGLDFYKIDDQLYSTMFLPDKSGLYSFLEKNVAVNYKKEYLDVGFNDELRKVVSLTGGSLFEASDVDSIVEKVRTDSIRQRTFERFYRWPFILAVIILLLIEIIARRTLEGRR